MRQGRIVIVTGSPLCRNPRVLKEATALGQAGYDVAVLTVIVRDDFEALDRGLLAAAPFRRVAIDLRGTRGLWSRAVTRMGREFCQRGIESAGALGPVGTLRRALHRLDADLVIAHTEVGLAAARPRLASGQLTAVDLEDWHSEDLLADARRSRPLRLLRTMEREYLQHAAFATTTSAALADALTAELGGKRPHVVRNVFPLQPPLPSKASSHPRRYVWFSQTVGPGRGLEEFIAAWKSTRIASMLTLIGDISRHYRERLQAIASSSTAHQLVFQPPVSPEQLPAALAAHDIGLALELSEPPSRDLTISNKFFQYLDAGLAVLATPTSGQREAAMLARKAVRFVDLAAPESIVGAIDEFATAENALAAAQRSARQAAERELNWEMESRRVVALVEQALTQR